MVALVPPVPAPTTTHSGTGFGSSFICSKIDSAMLLLPRQSVARSAWVNWSMKCPPSSAASRWDSRYSSLGWSTKWQRPPWRSISSTFSALVVRGITAMKDSPSSRAKYASDTAVEPDDASITGVFSTIQPLHRA